MAGTGVPGRAEGILIPAFKSACPNTSLHALPWRFTLSTVEADGTHHSPTTLIH